MQNLNTSENLSKIDHKNHWTFEKKINVGHIITTITVVFSIALWALQVEKRVSANENNINQLNASLAESKTDLNKRLDRIENKLDRLIEKNH